MTKEDMFDDNYPCNDCSQSDYCDGGGEAKYCCTLCQWLGGGWDCDNCDPMDI